MKKSCMHQSRGRRSNKVIWFFWFCAFCCDTSYMSREGPSLAQCEWTNDGKSRTAGYGYIGYNMEWEAAHSLAQRTVWKDILEGTKGKICYRSAFVLTSKSWHRIRETKKQHCEEKNQKTAFENGNNSGINQDKTNWRETLQLPRNMELFSQC